MKIESRFLTLTLKVNPFQKNFYPILSENFVVIFPTYIFSLANSRAVFISIGSQGLFVARFILSCTFWNKKVFHP